MILSKAKPGDKLEITGIEYRAGLSKSLYMGLIEGSCVTCLSTFFTAMEFDLYGQRIILSKQLADTYSCKKLN